MPAKCDYICLSKEELERLRAECVRSTAKGKSRTAKKKTTAKKNTASKPKAKTPVKRVTVAKAVKKKKTKIVNKNKNKNRNVNTNNNMVSVSVKANPKAVSNVYLVTPQQPRTVEVPKRKRHTTYDAPFLPRRNYDGSVTQIPQRTSTKTVYVERSAPMPEIIVDNQEVVNTRKFPKLSGLRKSRQLAAPQYEVLPAESSGSRSSGAIEGRIIDADYTIEPAGSSRAQLPAPAKNRKKETRLRTSE